MPERVKKERAHGGKALGKLAGMGKEIVEDIEKAQPPKLKIPSRSTSNILYDEKHRYFVLGPRYGVRSAASMKQVKKFAQLLCTADFAKELIENGKFATLREMYYTAEGWDTGPFHDQGESDLMVEDLEATFGLKREDLGLVPEEDGAAVYGRLVVKEEDAVIDATKAGRGGYTIPPTIDDVEFLKCKAKRVIAIETMGMYHRFVQEQAWKKFDALVVGLKGQAARATRRFLKRANEELGLPVYLFCVEGDELLLVQGNDEIKAMKIRDVVEEWKENPAKIEKVVSVTDDGKIQFNPIINAFEHHTNDDLYEITVESGYNLRVTENHRVMVYENYELKPKLAKEIREGDLVAACLNLPNVQTLGEVNVLREIENEAPALLKFIHTWEDGTLRWRKTKITIPQRIKITREFCRLLGYYAAEGNVDISGVRLSFNSKEVKYVNDVISCVKKVFGCPVHLYHPHSSEVQIVFGGKLVTKLFEDVFKIGRNAATKRVPNIIFNVQNELKIEFLRGYFRGDGRVDIKDNSRLSLWAKTVSRELISGLLFLITQLGGYASVQHPPKGSPSEKRPYLLNISNRHTLTIFSRIAKDLNADVSLVGKTKKAPYVGRIPSQLLSPLRPVLRYLLRGSLGRRLPPAAWKDKRIARDRIERIFLNHELKKTAKVLQTLCALGQENFTSSELTKEVNSRFNPSMSVGSVRSVLNHLRRYDFVEIAGSRGHLKLYTPTDKAFEIKKQLLALKFIQNLVENRIALLPVKNIRREKAPEKVYDIEVASSHTFVGGLGPIVQHNCDGDPFGFHIAMVAVSGSAKLAYINHELAVPDAKYIGVTASDIVNYKLPTDKLRELDITRLKQLQKDPRYNTEFWQSEIKKMLELGKKAEQQAFAKYGLAYVVKEYLPAKLKEVEGQEHLG